MAKQFQGSLAILIILILCCWPAAIIYYFMKRDEGQQVQGASRNCPNCGRPIPMDAQVCPYCGKNFRNP